MAVLTSENDKGVTPHASSFLAGTLCSVERYGMLANTESWKSIIVCPFSEQSVPGLCILDCILAGLLIILYQRIAPGEKKLSGAWPRIPFHQKSSAF
jgi:hypothetical protein